MHPSILHLALAACLLPFTPSAFATESDDCVNCNGFRTPGSRGRELAVLNLIAIVEEAERAPASSDYDFSLVPKLPVLKRPDTDQTIRMADSDPLMRAMHTNSIDFYRLRYLLPPKSRIAGGKQFQAIIDDATLKITETAAGKLAICPFAVDSEKDIASYFQVSSSAAKKIRQNCAGTKVTNAIRRRLEYMRSARPPFQPEPPVPFKNYVFVFSESGRPGVESYTSKKNTTYLILSQETMNPDHLLRAISHEIAVSYDQLSRIGYLHDPVTWDQGVNFAFGRGPADPPIFQNKGIAEVKQLKCAIRDPALKYAATAQRAFRFEDEIVSQRGEADHSPAVAAQGNCGEALAKNSVLLEAMSRAVSWETGWYEAACGPLEKHPEARVKELLARIKTIESIQLKFSEGGKSIGLCELIMNPRIGPSEPDLYSGGPRPRMGGWSEMKESMILERALHGETLSPDELKALGSALSFPNVDQLYDEEDKLEGRGR